MNKKGNSKITEYAKPKEKMFTEKQVREKMLEYYNSVIASFYGDEFPSFMTETGFADKLGCDKRTLYNYFNNYFPHLKKEFEELRGETLAMGAMLGRYQSTMAIFAQKNWCDWKDKQETTANVELHGSLEDALDSLPDD